MRLIPNPPGEITGGEIIFHKNDGSEIDLLSISEEEMNHTGKRYYIMIFQGPMTSLNPVFTCGDQVVETLYFIKK